MPHSSILQILRERAEVMPDKRAYTFLAGGEEVESLTFGQLYDRARVIGVRLQQLRAKDERVLLLYPPGLEYVVGFYGCLTAGAVAVPAYPPRMNRNFHRIEAILDDANPKVVFTTETIFRQLSRRLEDSPKLKQLEFVLTDQVSVEDSDAWVDPQVEGDSIAFLQYTSASTSKPKGVIVSHENILHNQALMKEACGHDQDTVIVSWQPLFHDMGLIGAVLASLYNGVPCYLMSPADFLRRPRVWLEAITRYRGTFSGGPDFGFQLCADRITPSEMEGLDLSSWKVAYNGAEPVRAQTLRDFSGAFSSCGFRPEALFPCYGLAEHTLFVAGGFFEGPQSFSRVSIEEQRPSPTKDDASTDLVSCGKTIRDSTLIITDPATCRQFTDGEIGEIWLAGPSVGHGYWNQSESSERDFRARLEGGDGPFLRTGDLGFIYGGELYVTGRLKDLIIIRGRNLFPQDIEQTVEQCHPAIRPAFVAAVSVRVGGAERLVVAAEVRRDARRNLDTAELMHSIRSAVAAEYGVDVSAVVLLRPGRLHKTSSGKTQRSRVSCDFLAGELGVLADWRDPSLFTKLEPARQSTAKLTLERTENWLVERVAALAKLPPERINRDLPISFYGFDSMVAVAFVCELEDTFAVAWDVDRLFDGDPTVCQLARQLFSQIKLETPGNSRRAVAQNAVESSTGGVALKGPSNGGSEVSKVSSPLSDPPSTMPVPAKIPGIRRQSGHEHVFRTKVNPELGRVLSQMGMDKTFVRGEGCWLWDEKGRRYLDFLAQYGALPFGFNPPRIWEALNDVRKSGEPSFVQPSNLNAAGELAQRLLAAAPPGMAYATFANSGAEAIEAAIKLCRSTTGRRDILSASNGFHGKTMGALSATAKEKYQTPFGAPEAGFHYVPFGDIEVLREALKSGRYAGFLVEPIQGEGGIVEPPVGYLRSARKACREAGTLFVADEIQTGIGRTGSMFVCSELGVTPDIMTVAKALGGGLIPIGACLSTAAAYNENFALKHTSTFAGNTLACRAGLATLDLLEENDGALLRHVAENGARLKEGLLDLKRRFPGLIAEVRGRGYLLGLRFGIDRYSVNEGLLGYLGEQEAFTFLVAGHLLNFQGLRIGCTLNQGGVIRIEPPLTATWEECLICLTALEGVLQVLERHDMAALTAQITGFHLPEPASTKLRAEGRTARSVPQPIESRSGPQPGDGRFAFLVHPLAWKDYADLDGTLSVLSEDQLATLSSTLADNFDPFVIGETRVVGKTGQAAYGEYILIPRRAQELKSMPHEIALGEIRLGVALGQSRGAKIVGLGAYTSVVTRGGLSLKGFGPSALTTGNSYTAFAAYETVRMAAAEREWELPRRTVAVLGAGGAIGQALSMLLARDAGRLLLLGNPDHPDESLQRLCQIAGRLVCSLDQLAMPSKFLPGSIYSWVSELGFDIPAKPDRAALVRLGKELIRRTGSVVASVDAAAMLPEADIVVCCTSTPDPFVRDDYLRRSAVVCDVSRPSNIEEGIGRRRPDLMILNGGVVRMPGNASLGINASLSPSHAYACMAETMMLAMTEQYRDTSLGFDLPLSHVLELGRRADELDFQVVLDQKKESVKEEETVVRDNITQSANIGSAHA